jgi:two-component system, cell cycle response regulator
MASRPRSEIRMPAGLRGLVGLLALAVLLSGVVEGASVLDPLLDGTPAEVLYDGVLVGSAVLCLARAALHRCERRPWGVMGVTLLLYAGGNVWWSVFYAGDPAPPYPSVSDGFWLAFYPLAYVAVIKLVRLRLPHLSTRLWLDGLIALLVVCALSAAVVVEAVLRTTGGDLQAIVTNLAYPVADTILAGIVIGAIAAGRGKVDRTWVCFALGIVIFAAVDTAYVYKVAEGTYVEGALLDILWPVGALLIGLAAWQPAVRARPAEGVAGVLVPVGLALGAIGLLAYDHVHRISHLALALDTAALLAVVTRFALTHHQSRQHLIATRRQARTDALTGLGNRFLLMHDLEALRGVDEQPVPHLLLLFDLDGFKNYNDSYGHPAGDALLSRLGARLAAAVAGAGTAYRMGGDEFCVLAPWPADRDPAALIEGTRATLAETGEGFTVGASYGHALLPQDGADAAELLRAADRRLYAEKNSGRISARVQSTSVLRRVLDEWDADLGSHGHDVARMAAAVSRRLGLDDDAMERVVAAAELHDVGKIAIPRAILHKPGPLDAGEWEYVRRHTLIGERILQAAPALGGVGRLIRSSHERWDGRGYPDGLAGDEIPLGSQIVFICDAFSAMTTDRPYRRGIGDEAALAELRRGAGTQFSPAVVDAFVAEHAAAAAAPVA